MRKLLNTLYVLSEENYLTLDGENLVVLKGNETAGRYPLHIFDNIVSFSYKGATPALMGACAERNIGLSFFNPYGKFLARTMGKSYGNVLLRKQQYFISNDNEKSIYYVRNMITGKIFNCRWSIERTLRDHGERIDYEKLKHISYELNEGIKKIQECSDIDTLRGMEGQLASRYFSAFDNLIINQKDVFYFNGRNRRPPLDNVNALLSFAYTILGGDCANALESNGLDSYVGFMHTDRPGRISLALDLMEELRGIMADRFVISLINMKVMKPEYFEKQQDGAVWLNDMGRKQFFKSWHERKKEVILHPYLKEKVEWGLVPHIQALLLARTIRGDLEEYPPFLWK